MPKAQKENSTAVNWDKFGLNESNEVSPQSELGSEYSFGPGGHVALEGNELFAEELVRFEFILLKAFALQQLSLTCI